ncbi:hypothetical protein B0681_03140 [Moraxella porci DSM 25326]|uniref:Uncharacterized protein n=1 Tax=Moraxella porci DSM 25326 TaxID=573983 RepID=A0A1T0CV90_9GAMM|nr:hypothetical protein [Moraxella porci]OOS26149.1 hypothetical protein B0681_03140 [Moraxella porci DSM 25326]
MNLPAPSITTSVQSINQSFSPQILERFKSQYANKILWIDDKFHKTFMRLIDNSSINDAKQIIYIHNSRKGKIFNFDYKSEYDILVELQSIVCSLSNPTKDLQELFFFKSVCLLPVGTYSWIAEDLDAILFFLNRMPGNPIVGRAFRGGKELISAFINFIQFHTIDNRCADGFIRYIPINFATPFDLEYYSLSFEEYKKWYLNHITPRKEFRWLEKCNDMQLDSLIENLEKNNLRILKGVFHPVTTQDKISLIISSINSVDWVDDQCHYSPSQISECSIIECLVSGTYNLSYLDGWIILNNLDKNILSENINPDKYMWVGIRPEEVPESFQDTAMQNGSRFIECILTLYAIPAIKTVIHKGRDSYIKQLYDASRQKRHRDSQSLSKEECLVKILKKNMPILEKLAQAEGLSKDKYINKLIVEASKPK